MISTYKLSTCEDIVALTLKCLENNSALPLYEYLATDFTIKEQKGEKAKIVLDQIIGQLNDSIVYIMPTIQEITKFTLNLKYNIEYKKLGVIEATFIFDDNNLLRELKVINKPL